MPIVSNSKEFIYSIGASRAGGEKQLNGTYLNHHETDKEVDFRILSDSEITSRSIVSVTDPRFEEHNEPVENGLFDRRFGHTATAPADSKCGYCNMGPQHCAGHWGRIELAACVVQFESHLLKSVECICLECFAILPTRLEKCKRCGKRASKVEAIECKQKHAKPSVVGIRVSYTDKLHDDVVLTLTELQGILTRVEECDVDGDRLLRATGVKRPSSLVSRTIFVPPPKQRQDQTRIEFGGTRRRVGAHSNILQKIVSANEKLWEATLAMMLLGDKCPSSIALCCPLGDIDTIAIGHIGVKRWHDIKSAAQSAADVLKEYKSALGKLASSVALLRDGIKVTLSPDSGDTMAHGSQFNGLWDCLDGCNSGGTGGLIKKAMLASRIDNSGRGVAMSDPSLQYSEVGVPRKAMLQLTKEVGLFCRWGEDCLTSPAGAGGNLWGIIRDIEAPRRDLGSYVAVSQNWMDSRPNRHWNLEGLGAKQRLELISIIKKKVKNPNACQYYINATQIVNDGDVATVGRSPKHHAGNGSVFQMRVTEGDTVNVPTAPWKLAAGDFDGDNADIFVPRSAEARAEAQELHAPHRSIATGAGSVDARPSPNCCLGLNQLTKRRQLPISESVSIYRRFAGAIALKRREAFQVLSEKRIHIDSGPGLSIHRRASWMDEAICRIEESGTAAWETCVAELLSLCVPVGMDADVVEREEVHHLTSSTWHFHAATWSVSIEALLWLCDEEDYLVLALDKDDAVVEGLMCPAPDGAKGRALERLGIFEGVMAQKRSARQGIWDRVVTTTLCRGVPPHSLERRVVMSVRQGRFVKPIPRLTNDFIQELYVHIVYCAQGEGLVAHIDCMEVLAAEASSWFGIIAGSPMDFMNALRVSSPVDGMRFVSERAIEGACYYPPSPAGGLYGGGVAVCIEAGIKGSPKQLVEMGVSLGQVTGRHCSEGRLIRERYMTGLTNYQDFVMNQQKAIRAELSGKDCIGVVGYMVKMLYHEYLSLVTGHMGEVYHLAGKGRKRLVDRHFGGDGLDAPKLIRQGAPQCGILGCTQPASYAGCRCQAHAEPGMVYTGQARSAVRIEVALQIANRWCVPNPIQGEFTIAYLQRLYDDLLLRPDDRLFPPMEAMCMYHMLCQPVVSSDVPAPFRKAVRRCLSRLLPPWRMESEWVTILGACNSMASLGQWLRFACYFLRRIEYARVEYGCPVGGQAVEVLMMSIQQAALDSKHGANVTAEVRLEDLIIRAAPSKRIVFYLQGHVAKASLLRHVEHAGLGESLVAEEEVYPMSRIGRQSDMETMPRMGDQMKNAWGVCLRLKFNETAVTESALERFERHVTAKVLDSPFELRVQRDATDGLIEVACGVAEPPVHIALREVYAAYISRGIRPGGVTTHAAIEALSDAAIRGLRKWGGLDTHELIASADMLVRTCFCGLSPPSWWSMLVANGQTDVIMERERNAKKITGRASRDIHTGLVVRSPAQTDPHDPCFTMIYATMMGRNLGIDLTNILSLIIRKQRNANNSLLEQCQRRVRGEVEEMLEAVAAVGSWDARTGIEIEHVGHADGGWTKVTTDSIPGEDRAAPLLQLAGKLSDPLVSWREDDEAVEHFLREGGEIPACFPDTHPSMMGLYCDSPTTIEAALGFEAGRYTLLCELDKLFPDADPRHARLLATMSMLDGCQRGIRRSDIINRSPMERTLYEAPRKALTKAALAQSRVAEGSVVVSSVTGVPIAVGTGLINVDIREEEEGTVARGEDDAMAVIIKPPSDRAWDQRKRRGSIESNVTKAALRAWRGPGTCTIDFDGFFGRGQG